MLMHFRIIGTVILCLLARVALAQSINDDFTDGVDNAIFNNGVQGQPFSGGSQVPFGNSGGNYNESPPEGLEFTANYPGGIRTGHFIAGNYVGRLDKDWELYATAQFLDPRDIGGRLTNDSQSVALSLGVQNLGPSSTILDDLGVELSVNFVDDIEDSLVNVFSDENLEDPSGDDSGEIVQISDGPTTLELSIIYDSATGILTSGYNLSPSALATDQTSVINQTVAEFSTDGPGYLTFTLTGYAEADVEADDGANWLSFTGRGEGLELIPEPGATGFLLGLAGLLGTRRLRR